MMKRRNLWTGIFVGLAALGAGVGNTQGDDCLQMTVSTLFSNWEARWDVDGATPNSTVVVVWGFEAGETVADNVAGYCATFGIADVFKGRVVGITVADGNGHASVFVNLIPRAALGKRIYSQAAERDTCPNECVSNIDSQVVTRY